MEDENAGLIADLPNDSDASARQPMKGVLSKIVLPALIMLSLSLTIASPLVNKYFWIHGADLILPTKTTATTSLRMAIFSAFIGSSDIEVYAGGGAPAVVIPFELGKAPLDGSDFEAFSLHIIGMQYTITAWSAITVLGYMVMVLMGIAFLFQLAFREFPTTLAFKSGSSFTNEWRGAVPVWLVVLSAVLGMVRMLLVTSFVQGLSTRLAIHSIHEAMAPEAWKSFQTAMGASIPQAYKLTVLRALGAWYEKSGAAWSFSTYAILFAVILNMIIIIVVFYFDTRTVRLRWRVDEAQAKAINALREQMKNLPRHCRVLNVWVSISMFGLAILLTKLVGMHVYNSGLAVNRLPWTSTAQLPDSELIDDVIISGTHGFWFNPPTIVDGTVMALIPLVFALIIGSVDRRDAISKFVEVLAYGYLIRAVAIGITILPTSMAVLQAPHCYGTTKLSFFGAMATNDFCNDMMYSGHATLVLTPAFTLMLMIIHGPFRSKMPSLVALMICVAFSCMVVIIGRFHYTADVLVSFMVCFLLTLVHAPAWKILFSYRKFELGAGSAESLDKVSALLESASIRTVSLTKGRKIDNSLTNWDAMEAKQQLIRKYIEKMDSTAGNSK